MSAGVNIKVEMLGGFTISVGDIIFTEQTKRASKAWKLIQYLITHRSKFVPQEEIIDVFFGEDEGDNPSGAVRTMIYRARGALASGGLPGAEDMIVASNGGYMWTNTIVCDVDAEMFEALCKNAGAITDDDERLEVLLKAAALYKGDFLPNAAGEMWVIPLARWYRSLYIKCVHEALELLAEADRIAEAEELCVKVLRMDPFDERTLEHYLKSLLAQGKRKEALEEYKRLESMFFDVLGVEFSDTLRSLYSLIEQPDEMELLSLKDMLAGWLINADFAGAYYCDLSVFKAIYQIEARSAMRSGRTTYIVRFDTKHEINAKDGGVMRQLAEAITLTLRKGDLFTRASPGQYVLMLHNLTYENCKMLVSKIMDLISAKHLSKMTATSIRAIDPFD